MTIPFSKVTIGEEEEEAVLKCLRSGWLAAGPETEAFEQEFSNYISPPGEHYYCIFTNSCTSALKMAFKYFKEEEGYRSFVYPSNTFCATYSSGVEMGLNACLPNKKGFRRKNIFRVNVHYGGVLDARRCLIEDSAHRIEPNDPLVGKIRCYSFYATKNISCGSGGMLVTNDKDIYERCRLFWRDGLSTSTADRLSGIHGYRVEAFAGGYDGNDIAAAIGRVQLRRLPEFTKRRNHTRDLYNDQLGQDWQGNHLYPYMVSSEDEVYNLLAYLKEHGITGGYHYPGTGWTGVSLPIYPLLTDDEALCVCQTVKRWHDSRV